MYIYALICWRRLFRRNCSFYVKINRYRGDILISWFLCYSISMCDQSLWLKYIFLKCSKEEGKELVESLGTTKLILSIFMQGSIKAINFAIFPVLLIKSALSLELHFEYYLLSNKLHFTHLFVHDEKFLFNLSCWFQQSKGFIDITNSLLFLE